MSNTVAGDIFQKIIEEVVSSSQTDFEESGVNQQTLVELRETWQQKLSARNVAQMPWDPKPEPVPAAAHSMQSGHKGPAVQRYDAQPLVEGPRIKAEPGTEQYNGGPSQPGNYIHQAMNPQLAQQRAASLLQQQFGSQANASLDVMNQRGIALPGQQAKAAQNIQLPGQPHGQPQSQQAMQQQYAQQLKRQQSEQQPAAKRVKLEEGTDTKPFSPPQPQGQTMGYASQTDGADDAMQDWFAMRDAARSLTVEDITANDRAMRDLVLEGNERLSNGLMVPLEGHKHRSSIAKRSRGRKAPSSAGPSTRPTSVPQLDGDLSDEDDKDVKDEEDEDAINSDLDSSDDDPTKVDDDDDDYDSMLCTYDKVQRVKNKWKCVLKDGILLANGKEYMFHKASGEFEW